MAIMPFGLGGTRYGVRIGSNASQDPPSTFYGVGFNANWGQGPNPFYDSDGGSLGNNGFTAIPYLQTSNPVLFDFGTAGTTKMTSPQDIFIPKATAVDTSMNAVQSAVYGLGSYGAVGTTLSAPSFGVTVSSLMIDVTVELMLAGLDKNTYKAILNNSGGNTSTPISSNPNAYTPLQTGPWITAVELFSNNSIYCYVGSRDDDDTILGVVAYVNCSLAKLSYSFAAGSGLMRSFSLISPWAMEFNRAAIKGWYTYAKRFRLVTPGNQINSTVSLGAFTLDYKYAQFNGGEFMGFYQGATGYATSAADAGVSGAQLLYQEPGSTTPGGWGFLAPPNWTILGTPVGSAAPVTMPSLGVGRDTFVDFAFYNPNTLEWEWASFWVNTNSLYMSAGSPTFQGMMARTATATWPGGLVRLQGFTIGVSSRASLVEEMGNRMMVGAVSQPSTSSGTFSVVETDVGLWTSFMQSPVQATINYNNSTPTASPVGTPAATAVTGVYLSDPGTPTRLNAVVTVATPGPLRNAMVRFAIPNIRVGQNGRRIMVNGVGSKQYTWVCEDGGVASASTLTSSSNYANTGNLGLNSVGSPNQDSFGLILGLNGGQTGGFAVQSFYTNGL